MYIASMDISLGIRGLFLIALVIGVVLLALGLSFKRKERNAAQPSFEESKTRFARKKRKKGQALLVSGIALMLLSCGPLVLSMISVADTPSAPPDETSPEPLHVHEFGEWYTTLEPTCIEIGLREHSCPCGESEVQKIDIVSHTPGEKATCTTNQICTVCNMKLVAALGHTPGEKATCIDPQRCTVCDEEIAVAKGHAPGVEATCTTNQICTVCGVELAEPRGHSFTSIITVEPSVTENGYIIFACLCGKQYREEIIPEFFEVTEKNRHLIGYTGEDGESLVIPVSFQHNGTWYRVTSIGDYAFRYCNGLTAIIIPNSITSIGHLAFRSCYGLTSIAIPEGVTSIGEDAFYDCYNLTSITIPDGVMSLGAFAFSGCSSLTSITIPNSVMSIGDSAFENCRSLTSIIIPEGVTNVDYATFYGCSSLTSITIPKSVTSIDVYAFYICSSLMSITFEGTVAEWNAISKGQSWNAGVPATEVVCSDGVVSLT